jgi:hypothetical protein
LIIQEVGNRKVDGLIVAGDLNNVASQIPIALLEGPVKAGNLHLETARVFHIDGLADWTWDGRGTPFPSGILDYQLFSSASLSIRDSYIFDSEDLDAETLSSLGLQTGSSNQLSRHRPLVVNYTIAETQQAPGK